MRLLLDQQGKNVTITEDIILSAIDNVWAGKGILFLLLDRGVDMTISDKVLTAETRTDLTRHDLMRQFLRRRRQNTYIPPDTTARIIERYDYSVVELALSQQRPDFEITSEILVSAAKNRDKTVVKHLLKPQWGVNITEDAVRSIAELCDGETIGLVFDHLGNGIHIANRVIYAAARNNHYSFSVMSVLLDRGCTKINIKEDLVRAARQTYEQGRRGTISLLLSRVQDKTYITNKIVMAVAEAGDVTAFSQLLDKWNDKVAVTEKLLTAVVCNRYHPTHIMSLLLDRRGEEVVITEGLLSAIAHNRYHSKDIMSLLLDRRGEEIVINESVVKEAANTVTPYGGGDKLLELLLDRRGSEVKITDELVETAIKK